MELRDSRSGLAHVAADRHGANGYGGFAAVYIGADEADDFRRRIGGSRGCGQPVGENRRAVDLERRLPGHRRLGQAVQAELVGGDGGKKARAGAEGSPEEIRMLAFAGDDLVPSRSNHFDGCDIGAGRPPFPRVPPEAAREDVAA